MNAAELTFTLGLAAILLGLAGYFGRRQVRTLRGLAVPDELGGENRRYLRAQAYRRLLCSALMVVIAGMFIGSLFLDTGVREIREQMQAAKDAGHDDPPTEEQKDFLRVYYVYWVGILLLLLALVALAAVDFWAIARYGLSEHRRLQADHRAALEEQVARRRRERNGSR